MAETQPDLPETPETPEEAPEKPDTPLGPLTTLLPSITNHLITFFGPEGQDQYRCQYCGDQLIGGSMVFGGHGGFTHYPICKLCGRGDEGIKWSKRGSAKLVRNVFGTPAGHMMVRAHMKLHKMEGEGVLGTVGKIGKKLWEEFGPEIKEQIKKEVIPAIAEKVGEKIRRKKHPEGGSLGFGLGEGSGQPGFGGSLGFGLGEGSGQPGFGGSLGGEIAGPDLTPWSLLGASLGFGLNDSDEEDLSGYGVANGLESRLNKTKKKLDLSKKVITELMQRVKYFEQENRKLKEKNLINQVLTRQRQELSAREAALDRKARKLSEKKIESPIAPMVHAKPPPRIPGTPIAPVVENPLTHPSAPSIPEDLIGKHVERLKKELREHHEAKGKTEEEVEEVVRKKEPKIRKDVIDILKADPNDIPEFGGSLADGYDTDGELDLTTAKDLIPVYETDDESETQADPGISTDISSLPDTSSDTSNSVPIAPLGSVTPAAPIATTGGALSDKERSELLAKLAAAEKINADRSDSAKHPDVLIGKEAWHRYIQDVVRKIDKHNKRIIKPGLTLKEANKHWKEDFNLKDKYKAMIIAEHAKRRGEAEKTKDEMPEKPEPTK